MIRPSLALYLGLIGLVVIQRLFELRLASRNAARAIARGATESGSGHYPVMVTLHALFLLSAVAEPFFLERPFVPGLAAAMVTLLALATALRYWAIKSLGERWTTRIFFVPGDRIITNGPYRFLRHPNYLAVVVEIFALPLVHSAYWTAMVFSISNFFMLRHRIRIEERALRGHGEYRVETR